MNELRCMLKHSQVRDEGTIFRVLSAVLLAEQGSGNARRQAQADLAEAEAALVQARAEEKTALVLEDHPAVQRARLAAQQASFRVRTAEGVVRANEPAIDMNAPTDLPPTKWDKAVASLDEVQPEDLPIRRRVISVSTDSGRPVVKTFGGMSVDLVSGAAKTVDLFEEPPKPEPAASSWFEDGLGIVGAVQ